ncbi:MAG: GAF domain-containing protein [Anaerolineales bacterium]
MNPANKTTRNFTLIGLAIGFLFPLFSTIVEAISWDLPINFESMILVQKETALLWVIDSAPLVIGFLAGLVGYRQANLQELNTITERRYQEELKLREQIDELNQDLERRVGERTRDLERRSRYIEAAADIGRAATSIYNLDELLENVVDLVSEKFEFYQAGIFIIDENNEYALMKAASSEGGKRMLARNHRLKVGEQGIVGYVTKTGQARIALDVGQDAVHFNTPELPHTRSEMALPLFYGGRVFGALDVQSTVANAFSQQDISALSVLADQISMAISNAMLFEDLQHSLESERRAFEKISSDAWQEYIRHTGSWGYKFTHDRIIPTDSEWPGEMAQAFENNMVIKANPGKPTLCLPIKIGSKPVGVIRLIKAEGQMEWNADEIELIEVISERISQALESARLFRATQIQAAQEQMTSDISSQLRQTLDIDTVLKTAAKQLGDALHAREVVIRMAPDEQRL